MARSVSSYIENWRQGPDLAATLKLCQRLTRICGKPGATNPSDHKTIDGFCAEAHHLFANAGSAEAIFAIAELCVTVGSLDRAEEVLESVPPESRQDQRVKRIRGKINLHKGVQGARGAPVGSAAHLLTGITHNKGLRARAAQSGQMRAVTPPPGSLPPAQATPSQIPSATPSSNPSAAPRRSFTPSPFANVPESAPPVSTPPVSSPPAPAPTYSAPPSAQSAPPQYSAPPSAQPAPPQYAPPPTPPTEEVESATKAHQYSPQELLALVTKDPNLQAAHEAAQDHSGADEDVTDQDPRTRGFDFSQGLPEEAFRPDQAGPHEARTMARESPMEDPDGPTRGRDVPDYLMKLAADAAGGEIDQDGPTRGREIPDYIAQLAAEAAGGEDEEGPTRGREIPPHLARAAAAAASPDDEEGPTRGQDIPDHVARMAARAVAGPVPDGEDDISTRLRNDPEEDLSTQLRGDPEDGINTQLRGDREDELSTQRAHLGQARDFSTGDDEMRSLIAAADAHDEMRSLIAAADAYIDEQGVSQPRGQPAPVHPDPAPPREPTRQQHAAPAREPAEASSLRPSPIPKPPSRHPAGPADAQRPAAEMPEPHAKPTRPDPIEAAVASASHAPVARSQGPRGVHHAVDLNLSELDSPTEERSGKAGWVVFTFLVLGAAAGGFFLRPILSGESVSPNAAAPVAQAPATPTALTVPGMLRGGKAGLGEADATLRKAEQDRGRTPEVTLARARFQLLRWLELGGPTSELGQAVTEAKESGVDAGALAFAEVATAIASNDPALPGVLTRIDGQPQRGSDAYYLLVAGIALEQRGSDESISRFRAAVGSEPGLHLAELSLIRSMLLYGSRTEAERRLKSMEASGVHKDRVAALSALLWLHRQAEGEQAEAAAKKPPPTLRSDADVPHNMSWIPAALAYIAEKEQTSRRGHLRRALEAIQTPSEATILAKLATAREDAELALVAAKKATETWSAPDALRVLGHAAVLGSDLDALKVDADGPIALELAAVRAYESGDLDALRKVAAKPGAPPGVRLRMERLFGLRPLVDSDLSTLQNPETVGGELVAVDALLDLGHLPKARKIVSRWPSDVVSPLRAHRLARLLRYEGERDAAIEAIEKAGDSIPAMAERVLIAAESPRRAAKILEGFDPKKLAAGAYLNAYIVARSGSRQSAAILMERERPPGEEDPLGVHVAAALAHGQLRNTDAKESIEKLLEAYPDNPDVRVAAQGVALDLPKLSKDAEADEDDGEKNDATKK